jgi:His-Xaa-Ser system protein HxsD
MSRTLRIPPIRRTSQAADGHQPEVGEKDSMTVRTVSFEASAHSSDAIQRAVYRLSDRLSCDLATEPELFQCTLHITSDDEDEVEATLGDFRNEVLDQTLRERIRGETQEVRNLILALAFSETGLIDVADH